MLAWSYSDSMPSARSWALIEFAIDATRLIAWMSSLRSAVVNESGMGCVSRSAPTELSYWSRMGAAQAMRLCSAKQ